MKTAKKLLFTLLLIFLAVIVFSHMIPSGKTQNTLLKNTDTRTEAETRIDFENYIQQLFVDEITSDSVTLNFTLNNPSVYGIENTETTLGSYSLAALQDSIMVSENRLSTLNSFDYNKLDQEEQLIYDILSYELNVNLSASDMLLYSETLGPTSGIQVQLPVLMMEYNFRNLDDVNTYIKLLDMIPDYFQNIINFEKEKSEAGLFMSQTTASAIIKQCEEFISHTEDNYMITVFNEKIESVNDITQDEITSFQAANKTAVLESVIPAYQNLIDALESIKDTSVNQKGLCYFHKGKKYYEYLVKSKTGSDKSISDIENLLNDTIDSYQAQMAKLLEKYPDIYYDAANLEYPWQNPEEAIEHLKSSISSDFPALTDDVECTVKYVDDSLKDSMSPAFYLTSAIDDYKKNVVYLNDSEQYDLSSSFTTFAHETYPGHLYQNCYFQSTEPTLIRSIINISGYTEGWGTYAELFSYKYSDIDRNVSKLLEENTIITLCLYAKADLGVNYLGWDSSELYSYLSDYGFSKRQSLTIFNSMVAEPAAYMPYTLGYLEIIELKKEAQSRLGKRFILKDFHKFILDTGCAPFSVIEKRMDTWIKSYH